MILLSCMFHRLGQPIAGAEQEVIKPFQGGNPIIGKPVPLEPHRIEPVEARTISAGGAHKRGNVASNGRTPADHRIGADSNVLVDADQSADDGVIADEDMPGEARGIRHDYMAAQVAVMGDVDVGHHKIMVTDGRMPAAKLRSSVDGDILTKHIVVADNHPCRLTSIVQMLGGRSDRGEWIKLTALADVGMAFDIDMGHESCMPSNPNMLADNRVGTDNNVLRKIGFWMDHRGWMDLHQMTPLLGDSDSHADGLTL